MFKNITWKDALTSKTWWGGVLTGLLEVLKGMFPANAKVMAIAQIITALIGLLGLVDRTAPTTPKAS